MTSEELKEIYDLLSKKLNTKIKNELEYLRKRNAELEKEVTDQCNELSKYKQDSVNIRAELETEYREKEKNLYKRSISELVGLLNREYFSIRYHDIYADCPHCNTTRRLTFVDPFDKRHSCNCECVNTIDRKEYFIQSRFVGVIKELSIRDKK